MAEVGIVLEQLPEVVRGPVEDYAKRIKEITSAQALTLFGAVAGGSFDPAKDTIRNVCVVERVDLSALRRLALHGVKLAKMRVAAPLIMTLDYIQASLDTFPLELIEIKQRHRTVFGQDYFEPLSFEDGHVRLQCERELKVILIGLRQGVLAAAGREKFIGALKADAASGLVRTLRGLLWLKGEKEAQPAAGVLTAIEKIADRNLRGIRSALGSSASYGWGEFDDFYHDVETLGEIVNGW